jgi:molybdopterin-guanine dinucleotide biosynthesis protein A
MNLHAEPMPGLSVTGLILAGGQGRRMAHADKGLLCLGGQPLVAHVAARLLPQVDTLLISANRNAGVYAAHGKVVPDDPALGAWQGPLAGIAAGLGAAPTEWAVTAACDTPFLPPDLVARLAAAVQTAGADAACVNAAGRRVPVCMLVRTRLAQNLRTWMLAGDDRRVSNWLIHIGCIEVPFDNPAPFMNINTPEDLQKAEAGF